MTAKYQAGMRVKYTQSATVKYGMIAVVGAFDSEVTNITIYGGADHTLANAAISAIFYTYVKAPIGFNCDPAKWTQTFTDTTNRSQSSPTASTWYNVGSLQLDIPIGVWSVEYFAQFRASKASAVPIDAEVTLSTANNSESAISMSAYFVTGGASGTAIVEAKAHMRRALTLAAKTTYYLNMNTGTSGAASVNTMGGNSTTIIRAVCALL